MAAIALVLERDLALGERPQRREDVPKLRSNLVVERGEPLWVQAAEVLVERIDENGERQVVLELRRRPAKNEVPADLGASGELPEKTRLADPRFALHLDRALAASIELLEKPLERFELVRTPDKVPGNQDHALWVSQVAVPRPGSMVLPTEGPSGARAAVALHTNDLAVRKVQGPAQGDPPMCAEPCHGKLSPCLATYFTTVTRPTSAGWCSRRSRDTRARF